MRRARSAYQRQSTTINLAEPFRLADPMHHRCTDVKTHPLDPNQLLIAYEGGVALYDLIEQVALRTYEYLVLPGAPGGHNDQSEGAFLERRPSCTCLAWRPDGKVFCAGYDDGSIVFWSVEDEDRELSMYGYHN